MKVTENSTPPAYSCHTKHIMNWETNVLSTTGSTSGSIAEKNIMKNCHSLNKVLIQCGKMCGSNKI